MMPSTHTMPLSGFLNLQTGILLITVFLLVCWLVKVSWQSANYPPGPWGCPGLGYIPNLAIIKYSTGMQPYRVFAKLAKKYGNICSIHMGSKRVVLITDYEIAREAFRNPHLNDRPLMNTFPNSYLGILLSSGKLWQHQRRFTLNQFRQLGIGKTSFQDKISEETKYLLQEFQKSAGKPISPCGYICNAVSNILCSVIFGKRFEYEDENFRSIIALLDESFRLAGNGALHLFIPILAHLQPKHHIRRIGDQMQSFINGIINEHKHNFDSCKLQDYIDVYLAESEHAKNNNNSNNTTEENYATDMSIYQTITQLFSAGSETTVTALRWSLLFMMAHPEIQSRIQQEIDSVVGRSRLPLTSDDLPFTEATIMEVQRFVTVAPLGVPHVAAEDTTLRGYTIPKGAIIMCNIWGIHHDVDVWKDPDQFCPERFLDSKGNVCRPEQYMPFSIGRRKCLGEHLAKMELFVIFTHLLHQFNFKAPPGVDKPSLEGTRGVTNAPKPFQVVAVKRE